MTKSPLGLFGELKKEVSVKEVKEVLDEDDEEIDEDDMCDGCGYPYNECKCESEEDEDNPTELPAEEEKQHARPRTCLQVADCRSDTVNDT